MRRTYALRPAASSDLDWLVKLRKLTMTDHLEAAGVNLSDDDHQRRVLDDFSSLTVVTVDDNDIGMLKVVRTGDQWRLVQVQLLPAFQGQGIGTDIVSDLLTDARQHQVPVTLSVLKTSPARKLYQRLGFRVILEKERSYAMRADA